MSIANVRKPQTVPRHYTGKWVAWTPNGLYILGAGDTPEQARQAAEAQGVQPTRGWAPGMGVGYEWVPPANERFIGECRPQYI